MTRLIDANKLKDRKMIFAENDYSKGWNDAIDAIMENELTITPESLEKLTDAVIEIIPKLVNSIVENLPKMIEDLKEDLPDRFLIDESGHITPIKDKGGINDES